MAKVLRAAVASIRTDGFLGFAKVSYDRLLILGAEFLTSRMSPVARARLFARMGSRLGVESATKQGVLGSFHGDLRDEVIFPEYVALETYDQPFQSLLSDCLFTSGIGTFVDIGGNIGLTSIPLAVSRRVNSIVFEPDPTNFRLLVQNIRANRVGQFVKAENLAVFSSEGILQFELSPDNLGDHRVRWKNVGPPCLEETHWRVVDVAGTTLDAYFEDMQLQQPVVVKVDVQGSEVHVLRGGTKFFRGVDVLLVEFHPYVLKRIGETEDSFIDALLPFRFTHGLFDWDKLGTFSPEPVERVYDRMKHYWANSTFLSFANLLLCRQSLEIGPGARPVLHEATGPDL